MKKVFTLLFTVCFFFSAFSQPAHELQKAQKEQPAWKTQYRNSYPHTNNVVHTKLDVSFDFEKSRMNGKAWITFEPHFYETDSLLLDAKGMIFNEISLLKGNTKIPLKYNYDSMQVHIKLDKGYKVGQKYTLFFDYIARPDEVKTHGSAAISDAKGLYFINPKGEKPGPTQIWTQGETESNSVWFPTIDKPNQKSTEEIAMTVPDKYVTLSNGKLVTSQKLKNGLRKDTWKMDLPHAPYLFFMGVGEFAIVKDRYKNMEVNYYVEKEYESVARKIFGETPAMIGFFEKITGVPYVWSKYSQMVGRDYVSGAMENTTATLHQESAYQNARQLVDGNEWEGTIAHELFHHWFGDLVTAESWSNLTLNESFANYSEYLWFEHRYGKDKADEHAFEDLFGYLNSESSDKDLVRFYYNDKEDMFDAVSYNKGGRILHMLRTYVGDSAFFKSLNYYLNQHKFSTAEAHDLRLAFEKVTGLDLNWFWNQWYFGAGEPALNISYDYADGRQMVIIDQTQKGDLFKLPVGIDIYDHQNKKNRYHVWAQHAADTFYFPSPQKPLWVNVDAEKVLVARKTDNKSLSDFEYQFKNGGNFMDRREALEQFATAKSDDLVWGLKDKYAGLRLFTLNLLAMSQKITNPAVLPEIERLAKNDTDGKTKGFALQLLAELKNPKYESLFRENLEDSSYTVAGGALDGLAKLQPSQAVELAKKYASDAKGTLASVISGILYANPQEEDFELLLNFFKDAPLSRDKIENAIGFASYLRKVKNSEKVVRGADEIMKFINMIPEHIRGFITPRFKEMFENAAKGQSANGNEKAASHLKELIH